LQPHGSKQPFFCVHGAGGNVFRFVELARQCGHCDPERPFYGLQARGLAGEGDPLQTVEEMAAHYIEAIRVQQPTGPYCLGGYSMGGLVVAEIARLFLERGEKVSFLGMLDAVSSPDLQVRVFEQFGIVALFARELEIAVAWEDLEGLEADEQLGRVLETGWKAKKVPAEFGVKDALRYLRVMEATIEATRRSRQPRPYTGKITVFRGEDPIPCGPDMGWAELAQGGIEVHPIAGDHSTIFASPHVEAFAELLGRCLDRAEEGGV
jgi:thioesterase domain-containing protein